MTSHRFDNLSSEPKGRDTVAFPINELWDLSTMAISNWGRPAKRELRDRRIQRDDELRLRTLGELTVRRRNRSASAPRFGRHVLSCLWSFHARSVPDTDTRIKRAGCLRHAYVTGWPWNPVRYYKRDIISRCILFSKNSSIVNFGRKMCMCFKDAICLIDLYLRKKNKFSDLDVKIENYRPWHGIKKKNKFYNL